MRIVWTSAFFVAGVGAAIVFGISPGINIPASAFWALTLALVLIASALIIGRKRAALALLCIVFMVGAWRGDDATPNFADSGPATASSPVYANSDRGGNTDIVERIRASVKDQLRSILGGDDAGLPLALLTGDRSLLDAQVIDDFRSAGLAHLLAISGFHVSLAGGIAMTFSILLIGKRRFAYLILPLLVVLLYATLAGFAPPITRAAIMFSVFILGRLMGRGSHTLAALALAGMLMVAAEPAILASLSFQLSFTAMLGISFVSPMLDEFAEVAPSQQSKSSASKLVYGIRRFIVGSIVISLAASIGTLPLIALHFHSVPLWGTVSTLVATPAMPILIFGSALTSIIAPVPIISELAVLPAKAANWYLKSVAHFFAHLPPRPFETDTWTVWIVGIYYLGLSFAIVSWPRVKAFALRYRDSRLNANSDAVNLGSGDFLHGHIGVRLALAVVLLIVGVSTWGASTLRGDAEDVLAVIFLQTSHGEAIFIETPNRIRVLIDGGGDRSEVADILGSQIAWWDSRIDIVILTHPDADHVGGLPEVLNRFQVDAVLHSGMETSSNVFSDWQAAIDVHNNATVVWPGMIIGLDRDIYLEVISAGCGEATVCTDTNNASIVARLNYLGVSFLLTGDIEHSAESRIASSIRNLRSTVLKVPHHGSTTSSSRVFVDAVNPSAVVIAAGTENRYGHPHPSVLTRLQNTVGEDRVLRTDQLGTIELRTDGERLWMIP